MIKLVPEILITELAKDTVLDGLLQGNVYLDIKPMEGGEGIYIILQLLPFTKRLSGVAGKKMSHVSTFSGPVLRAETWQASIYGNGKDQCENLAKMVVLDLSGKILDGYQILYNFDNISAWDGYRWKTIVSFEVLFEEVGSNSGM